MPTPKKPSEKPAPKKMIDVSAPGKSAPDSTSRPVVVSHRPMIEDPMVSKSGPEALSAPPLASKGKTIVPLTGGEAKTSSEESKTAAVPPSQVKKISIQPDASETEAETEKSDDLSKETPKQPDNTAAKPVPKVAETAKPTEEPAPSEDSPVKPDDAEKPTENEGDVPGSTKAAEERKKAELEAAKKAETDRYEKMVADKTYFAPIDTSVSSSGSKIVNILLFLLLLAIVGGILVINAGILDIGMDLPFDLIKNQ